MKRNPKSTNLHCLAVLPFLVFGAGCKDRADSPAVQQTQEREYSRRIVELPQPTPASEDVLPGASEVRSSLERRDYNEAVASLLALRGSSTEGRKYTEYLTLHSEVVASLKSRAPSDQNAADALNQLERLARQK